MLTPESRIGVWTAAGLAVASALVTHLLFGDIDLGWQDQGFFWYGARLTAEGAVPLRDFQSYEPGRYYWCALWIHLCGRPILGAQLGVVSFQALGLFCGLLSARRVVKSALGLVPVCFLLAAWMFPHHKIFESSLAMMAVFVAVRLAEKPSPARHLAAGVFVGLALFFGRNHALYSGVAQLGLVLYLAWKTGREGFVRRVLAWGLGVAIGSTPMILLAALAPGFAEAFLDSVLFFARHGPNLPSPAPWPWTVDYRYMSWYPRIAHFSVGTAFVLVPLVYAAGLFGALRSRGEDVARRALLIAATAVGLAYVHHVSVRSMAGHLAQCIHPMLLAGLALCGSVRDERRSVLRWTPVLVIGLFSFFAVWASHPVLERTQPSARPLPLVDAELLGEPLRVPEDVARTRDVIRAAVARHVPGDASLYIAPASPSLYVVLDRRAPVARTYELWQATDEEQDGILRGLAEVEWAVVVDVAPDGRLDLLLRNAQPKVWSFLRGEFEWLRDAGLPPGHHLFRRRGS